MRRFYGWAMAAAILVTGSLEAVGQERGRREVFASKSCWRVGTPGAEDRVVFLANIIDHRAGVFHHVVMNTRPMRASDIIERDSFIAGGTPIVSALPVAGSVRTAMAFSPTEWGSFTCDGRWQGYWQVGDNNAVQFCTFAFNPTRRLLCKQVLPP